LNTGFSQQVIKSRDFRAGAATPTIDKDYALFRAGESDEKSGGIFDLVACETPPGTVVQPHKDDSMVFEALPLMDCHQR
jgi:hypothetical protein